MSPRIRKFRCKNCHYEMLSNDKYCIKCGTERGKGTFDPSTNVIDILYGPPVKRKFKCLACGNIWITGALDENQYCSQCGKKTDNLIEDKTLDFLFDPIGLEEPYDVGEEPILFEEDQIRKLLDQRQKVLESYGDDVIHSDDIISNVEIMKNLEAMRQAGVDIPEVSDDDIYETYPRTEAEGDRINLSQTILELKGTTVKGYPGVCCPHCKSEILASVGYRITDDHYREFARGIHAPGEKDALYHNTGWDIRYNGSKEVKQKQTAFICLQCGKEFGNFEFPADIEDIYKKFLEDKREK